LRIARKETNGKRERSKKNKAAVANIAPRARDKAQSMINRMKRWRRGKRVPYKKGMHN